jgi:hypothetical protein
MGECLCEGTFFGPGGARAKKSTENNIPRKRSLILETKKKQTLERELLFSVL